MFDNSRVGKEVKSIFEDMDRDQGIKQRQKEIKAATTPKAILRSKE